MSAALVAALAAAPGVSQAGLVGAVLGDFDFGFDYGGYVRNEAAFKITNDENPFNQGGNIFNGQEVQRNGAPAGLNLNVTNDTVTRAVPQNDNSTNLEYLRLNFDLNVQLFDNLSFEMTARGIADPDLYDNYDPEATPVADPVGPLQQKPNLFEYRYDGAPSTFPGRNGRGGEPGDANEAALVSQLQSEKGSSPLEWAGEEYMLDLPKFYFEYQNGPLFLRAGNQQIAWGDLLFFRIMDVPNGLDLRRHQLLDFVAEEFSDKRVPSLGLRGSYVLPRGTPLLGGWEIDSFVQRFRPTIYPNPNTPYNAIPAQFTVHDQFKQYDDEFNYGIRLRGPAGPFDITVMAARRYNHFGVFQWTDSDVAQGLQPFGPSGIGQNLGALQSLNDATGGLFDPILGGGAGAGIEVPATDAVFADTVFEVDPTGVTSAREFAAYGALARLNHFTGLNTAIREFPAAQTLGAVETANAAQQERQEDLFLQASGGLRGTITREYFRENNFGLGISYRIEGPSDSLLFNQINASLEMKYTPDRKFTPLDLNPYNENVIEEDEYEIGLVFQKFIRYSNTFPSMFAVLQYLHRSESDIFNRHLSGFGGDPDADDPADRLPDGISSFNAVAFAFQQPFPNRVWRVDFAALYDVQGGLLLQPALRWKPNTDWTLQVFTNLIDTVHGLETDNALSTVGYADEITTRIEYQF